MERSCLMVCCVVEVCIRHRTVDEPLLLFATVSGEMNSRLMVLHVAVGVGRKHDSCVRTGLVVYSDRATIRLLCSLSTVGDTLMSRM